MIAAIRVRGDIDVTEKTSRTLKDLNLDQRNKCVVYENDESIKGMLKVGKDYIAYGEISEETREKLSEKKGEEIGHGDTVNLTPPSGGYKNTKKQSGQGGSLGKRQNMDKIINKMV